MSYYTTSSFQGICFQSYLVLSYDSIFAGHLLGDPRNCKWSWDRDAGVQEQCGKGEIRILYFVVVIVVIICFLLLFLLLSFCRVLYFCRRVQEQCGKGEIRIESFVVLIRIESTHLIFFFVVEIVIPSFIGTCCCCRCCCCCCLLLLLLQLLLQLLLLSLLFFNYDILA